MLDHHGSYLLEVMVGKENNVFPMVPQGCSVSEIRLSLNYWEVWEVWECKINNHIMTRHELFTNIPVQYNRIIEETGKLSFNMNSDLYTGSLLKTLVASKKSGRILELGTGGGLATSWILEGMDTESTLVTVENNAALMDIARQAFARSADRFCTGGRIRLAEKLFRRKIRHDICRCHAG